LATRYRTSNGSGTRDLFKQNIRYRIKLNSSKRIHKNIVNFNYGEKCFYGRMDYAEGPIVLRQRAAGGSLIGIRASKVGGAPIQALNFVAEAFDQMVLHFNKCVQAGLIRGDQKYLSQLLAYKAYEDPLLKFNELQSAYATTLRRKFAANKAEFLDIDSFLPLLIQQVEASSAKIPVTYPGFIKSKLCTVLNTGLAIEIADIECSDDQSKITEFVSSPNWEFFVRTCNEYGFMIDENIPWRLVADISSEAMEARESKYPVFPTPALLSLYYEPVGRFYYVAMMDYLLNFYNSTRKKFVRVSEMCNGERVRSQAQPQTYNTHELYGIINTDKRIAIYCALRIAEEKPDLSNEARLQIVNDCLEMYRGTGNVGDTLRRFENYVAKTFDKVGSYSYLNRTMPLKIAAARARSPRRENKPVISTIEEESDISNY
tara:strand:- start:1177 stop:2466 length:1290 start_codon:yes stop_codon:yes gene_type:complete